MPARSGRIPFNWRHHRLIPKRMGMFPSSFFIRNLWSGVHRLRDFASPVMRGRGPVRAGGGFSLSFSEGPRTPFVFPFPPGRREDTRTRRGSHLLYPYLPTGPHRSGLFLWLVFFVRRTGLSPAWGCLLPHRSERVVLLFKTVCPLHLASGRSSRRG